ncbi:MAG TPA: hypothetical protein VHB46_11210 [Burkholderiales bacterium]|nr:hypothetical protein [Burkholderiales bacterium]
MKSAWRFMVVCMLALLADETFAYRPFDSTDAGVADEGEFELEFGPLGYLREGGDKFLVAPATVLNLGIGHDREVVLESALLNPIDHSASGSGSILDDTMLTLKQVLRRGSLQDGSGVSVAAECGVLLPGTNGVNGTGGICTGIVSQRWDAATVHLNGGIEFTREHNWERSLGIIVEGSDKWKVRPVIELLTQRDNAGSDLSSELVGAIWRAHENLSFDFGLRSGRIDGEPLFEVRAGLTWAVQLWR